MNFACLQAEYLHILKESREKITLIETPLECRRAEEGRQLQDAGGRLLYKGPQDDSG